MRIASNIKPHNPRVRLYKESYRTDDIIGLVNTVLKTDVDDTEAFSRQFEPTRAGLRRLFKWVDHNFTYVEDPDGSQWVQTPSYLFASKRGDCKSYTVFISSVLQNMGLDHIIRYTNNDGTQIHHVYPVAILRGQEIPLDVVYKKLEGGAFGTEKPYINKKDFPMKGLYKLGNTGSTQLPMRIADQEVDRLRASVAHIPDSVVSSQGGDLTEMTEGEYRRWYTARRYRSLAVKTQNPQIRQEYEAAARILESGNIRGIGAATVSPIQRQAAEIWLKSQQLTRPAFEPWEVQFTVPEQVSGFFRKVGDFFKRIGNAIKDAWKKFVNWLFKGQAQKSSPYFIYLYLDESRVKSPEIRRRIQEQKKTFRYIKEKGKLDSAKLNEAILNGIADQTGASAEQIIVYNTQRPELFKPQAAGIGAVFQPQDPNTPQGWTPQEVPNGSEKGNSQTAEFIVKALKFLWELIKAIIEIFKRKDKENDYGSPSGQNSSDIELLEQEQYTAAGAGGGGNSLPLLLGAAAAGYYFLT